MHIFHTPSAQVVAALARALQLTDPERDHLYRLAGLVPPSGAEISDHIPPGLRRLLNRLGDPAAAAVSAADWQMIWWNRAWTALLGDPSSTPRLDLSRPVSDRRSGTMQPGPGWVHKVLARAVPPDRLHHFVGRRLCDSYIAYLLNTSVMITSPF